MMGKIRKFTRLLAALTILALAWLGSSGLMAQELEEDSVAVDHRAGNDSLARILVTSEGALDGRVIDGYVIRETKNFGPLAGERVKDTPFTINVVGENFMNNLGTMTPRDVFRRIPGVTDNAHSEINGFAYISIRGFQATGNANMAINGIPTGNIGAILFTEDLASIEVFSGLSGFMYGIGNVGGMANYNTKRPLWEFAGKLRYGTYNNSSLFTHLDIGGPIIK
ncbi:MAG: TonB-dependent receptor plug domain-containing protein, partial [Deltaproteobacteria bacterium]|nr:TonB-dependent receptor plug domain-containing protein [Deltaproteobacteria bacterium]